MATTNKVFIQIDNERIELTGQAKTDFIADQQKLTDIETLLETEYKAKQKAREDAIKKLAEVAGLTEAELNAIL